MAPAPTNAGFLDSLFGLRGQVAVVAGGSGRIGKSICHALAAAGATVAILDHDSAATESLADAITQGGFPRPACASADIADASAVRDAAESIARQAGPANILINCAQYRGQGFYSSRPEDYPSSAWDQVLAVNLKGVLHCCQEFGRQMIARRSGAIVNLASTYGVVSPDPRVYGESGVNSPVAYGASKAGVIQLTRYLAVHWREHNVRVNCLVPGGVYDGQSPEFVAEYCQRTPLGRMANADDYRGAVLFMASAASAYMTGAVVTVDGGWTAW